MISRIEVRRARGLDIGFHALVLYTDGTEFRIPETFQSPAEARREALRSYGNNFPVVNRSGYPWGDCGPRW